MASSRSAVAKIDWTRLTSALSLNPTTTSALTAFRKRNVDAHTKLNQYRTSRQTVDFSHYRSVLKNQKVIDQIEKAAKEFKPVTYDVSGILKSIDAFETEAVKNAQDTEKKIGEQLVDLEVTIKNIEQARAPDDLSVCTIVLAGADYSLMTCTGPFRIYIRRRNEWCKPVSGWYFPIVSC
jgi:ATP synthase D chain, mitochondrial (ATP5H)